MPSQIESELALIADLGYYAYWFPAAKKGYSGVAILTKVKPNHVEYGCGCGDYDREGRMIRADFDDFSVMSMYLPSGSSCEERQLFKFGFLEFLHTYAVQLRQQHPKLIIAGDYNICHCPIDIHNPKSNVNSSGFLPEERTWLESFITAGFIDTFRYFNSEPHHYTWWSFRANARNKNLGWRIDYQLASQEMEPYLKRAAILPEARHSDHCPVLLELSLSGETVS